MAGKSAHQFAQEFVHNIHMQRMADCQKPQMGTPPAKHSEGLLYKSSSFANYHPEDPDSKPSGPSVYTYLSNSIKTELERKSATKNRDVAETGVIHKLCKSMLSNENAKRIEEKANVLNHKASQDVMCERLKNEGKQWKEKLAEEKKRVEGEEMQDCTFIPRINEVSKLKTFKNHDEYYASQMKWDEKIKEEIVILSVFSLISSKIAKEKQKNGTGKKPKPGKSKTFHFQGFVIIYY